MRAHLQQVLADSSAPTPSPRSKPRL
jgi:hypothetical protein